jgi:hypothetical protein
VKSTKTTFLSKNSSKKKNLIRAKAQALIRRTFTAEGWGPLSGQSLWGLLRTAWHWDRLLSEYLGFPRSVPLHQLLVLILYITDAVHNDSSCAREIKSRVAMAKAVLHRKKYLFTNKLDLNLRTN